MTTIALAAVLTGCTTNTSGTAVPAADLGHNPAPVAPAGLQGLLLAPEQLNTLLRATGLDVKKNSNKGLTGLTTADDCAATWRVTWLPMYSGSGWTAIRQQYLENNDVTPMVWQAVVSFPLPVDASAFYAKQVAAWATCNNRRLDLRYTDETPSPDDTFTLGQASQHDNVLTIAAAQLNSNNWICERALTRRNNVVVDIQVCGTSLNGQAESVAKAITAKVPVS